MTLNWATIADIMCYLDTQQQSRCEKTCRVVRTLFSSGFIDSVDTCLDYQITDNILKQPKYSNLKNLANRCVSDVGVSHLYLHTLDASDNAKITDESVRCMSLHTLNAYYNVKITDESVRRMSLHTLDANKKITDESIECMSLHTLKAFYNKKITFVVVRGVKKMKKGD